MFSPIDPTDQTPIVVEVKDGRYECYGEITPRSQALFQTLQAMGGIADSVPDGSYNFNILEVYGQQIATLTPRI